MWSRQAAAETTLLYAMASHCALKGWRVLVSTTTHILRPENGLWAKTDAEIQESWGPAALMPWWVLRLPRVS